MSIKYQLSDARFIDYKLYRIPGVNAEFRGPAVSSKDYVACVGAAQTFGRFVHNPYPALLSTALGIDALNLGRGSTAPTFFLQSSILMERINSARLAVVQVLSGRSQSNSLFKVINHGMRGIHQDTGGEVTAPEFYSWLLSQDKTNARKIVEETRANYNAAMIELLDAIKVPKILLWLSVRTPEYKEELELPLHRLFGAFPQFVNRSTVNKLSKHCDAYVECVSHRGSPQPLTDRLSDPVLFEGLPLPQTDTKLLTENHYYPSPEMHEDAAALLIPTCRSILDSRSERGYRI